MRMLTSIVLAAFLLGVLASPLKAQTSHTATTAALDAAVQERVVASAADRDAVLRVLARPEVQAMAQDAGIDLRRAERAVATIDDSQLAELAAQARQVEQSLAGGQSRVTISTTTIIIALLLIILIIVAVN